MQELDRLITLEKDARDYGFEWHDIDMILDQAISECAEIRDAIENKTATDAQEEIGDLLHTAISVCIFAGFDTKETLDKAAKKFTARMNALKIIASERGFTSLKTQNTEFLLELWAEAKKLTKAE